MKQTGAMIYKALDSSLLPKLGIFFLSLPLYGDVFLAFSFEIYSSRHSNKYKLNKVRRKTRTIKQALQNKWINKQINNTSQDWVKNQLKTNKGNEV